MNSAFAETIEAVEQAAPAALASHGNTWGLLVYCAVIFAVIYFFMVRPNKKRMADYNKMLNGLKVGSKILCAGGIYGVVKKISGEKLEVEIAKAVVILINKNAVANVE